MFRRFVRTLEQYYAVDPGFSVDSVLAALVLPVPDGTMQPTGASYDDLLARLEAIPGVRSASLATWVPLGASYTGSARRIPPASDTPIPAAIWSVSDRFFESMDIPLTKGRTFSRTRQTPGGRTAILSESLAERLFADGNPIGGRVRVGAEKEDLIVIGVAAFTLQWLMDEKPPRQAVGAAQPAETFWAFRKLFEALASERPLMLTIDDVHWAEATLLDLLERADLLRRPERLEPFLAACAADWLGRAGMADRGYPQAAVLRGALQAARSVRGAQLDLADLEAPAIAAAVAFLMSEDAAYVTRQVLSVNGGLA